MAENLRAEILDLMKRSEDLKEASARNFEEAAEVSRRLLEIQAELDGQTTCRPKKTSSPMA